jgi:hypothetical protein
MVLFLEFLSGACMESEDYYTVHYYTDAEQAVSEYDDYVRKHMRSSYGEEEDEEEDNEELEPEMATLLMKVDGNVTFRQPYIPGEPGPVRLNIGVKDGFEVLRYHEGWQVEIVVEQKIHS